MIFMDFAHQPIGPGDVFAKWTTTLGMNKTGQFPFSVAWMKLFLNFTGLPVTPFSVRVPSAILGIMTLLAVYGCSRSVAGNAFALFVTAMFALNPFHIGISREAYFYPPLVLGSVLMLWALCFLIKAFDRKHSLLPEYYILLGCGFFLTTYSQPSAWSYAFIVLLILLVLHYKILQREKSLLINVFPVLAILTVIGAPLLFADWALPHMRSISSPEHTKYVGRVFGTQFESPFFMFARTLFSFSWGLSGWRACLTVVVVILGLIATYRLWRRSLFMLVIILLSGGGLIFYLAARIFLVSAPDPRYLLSYMPLYQIWLALGAWFAVDWLLARYRLISKYSILVYIIFASIALCPNIWPAYLATQLTGKPTPYWDIVRWCDNNLPRHSLVLVERWFDPWNELRIHNSTNVYFTFPVPSEPPDVFSQMDWPRHARLFMEKYPDAAYVEYFASERQTKGLVTNWHFARSVSFTNAAALKLAKLGLAHREEFNDPHTNKLVVTIFYNTREDVLANARASGKDCLVLYGPEWGYIKLWQQLRDFRDWRVLEREASLEVFNLTRTTNTVAISVTGMALNGVKRVALRGIADGQDADLNDGSPRPAYDFRHLQLAEWSLGELTLKPGLNRIVLSDPMWNISKVPALIDRVEVRPKP
ncbi:MAG: hypothetical protein WC299_09690 [Kiritimatiellia bacterium]